jgi:hypothetical protein
MMYRQALFPPVQLTWEPGNGISYISTELSSRTQRLGVQRHRGQQAFGYKSNAHHKRVRLGRRLACVEGHRFARPNVPPILRNLVIVVPTRIVWTRFCNSSCLLHGISLAGFVGCSEAQFFKTPIAIVAILECGDC